MDQKQLIDRCQLGDLVSFEELYSLYRQKALGMAYIIGGSRNMAEDIVQEAFVVCYQHIRQLKDPDMFNTWFYRILVRVGWRMVKKQKRHVSIDESGTEKIPNLSYNSKESQIDKINDNLLIREAIRKLTLPIRSVVILYYFNELTVKEISKILDCFQGTVKSRLHKARKQLKQDLGDAFKSEVYSSGKELKLNEE